MLSEAARLMRRSVDSGREERKMYRAAGRPCPRCSDTDRVLGSGRRQPNGLLVSELPTRTGSQERTASPGRVSGRVSRAPHLHESLRSFCLAAFAVAFRELDEGGDCRLHSRSTKASDGRRSTSTARSSVRSSRRGANVLAELPDAPIALEELEREPAAAIFAHAHAARRPDVAAGALPHGPAAAARGGRGSLRRLRLERRGVRARIRAARALPVRDAAGLRGGRACRRSIGRRRCWLWGRGSASATSHPARSRLTGRRPAACFPRASGGRSTGCCLLELEQATAGRLRRVRPTLPASSPTR